MKNLIILSAIVLSSLANAKDLGRVELSEKSISLPECGGSLLVSFKPAGNSNELVLKLEGDSKCYVIEKMRGLEYYFIVNPKKSVGTAQFSKNNKIYVHADVDNSRINPVGDLRHILLKLSSKDKTISDELEIYYHSIQGTAYEASLDQPTEENHSNTLEKNKLYSLPVCGGYAYLNPETGGGMLETYSSVSVFGVKSNNCNALINSDGTIKKLNYDAFYKTYYGSSGYSYGLIHKGNNTVIGLGNFVDLTRYYRFGILGYVSPDQKVDVSEEFILSLKR